jgi:radical SAM superfamily enzyme YgiQ (UPF0313 family)
MPNSIDPLFDAVFVGEGERSFVSWLKDIWARKPRDRIVMPNPVEDLLALPFPERPYFEEWAPIVGSRGCPYNCPFCATKTLWPRFRHRCADNIADEMLACVAQGHMRFNLSDDTPRLFTSNDGDVLARRLEGSGVEWRAQARVDQVVKRPERLATLAASGCRELCFGVESFDEDVLKALQKGTTPSMIEQAIRLTHEAGMTVRIYLMIGTPGETKDTPGVNIRALKRLGNLVNTTNLQTFMPLPGTPIWNDPGKYGVEIINKDFNKYNRVVWGPAGENPVWSPIRVAGLTDEQLCSNIRAMREYVVGVKRNDHDG